jgi:hypothetical protein
MYSRRGPQLEPHIPRKAERSAAFSSPIAPCERRARNICPRARLLAGGVRLRDAARDLIHEIAMRIEDAG